jgi:gluconokinase
VIIIIFGIAGAGKTTVGKLLAQELGWSFYDGDEFHPAANIEKMKRGKPLSDDDRMPWLKTIRESIRKALDRGENAVIACSAFLYRPTRS